MGKSVYVSLTKIHLPKGFNPRPEDDDGFEIQRMNCIHDGIRDYGLNAALVITPEGKDTYSVVAGERRYRSISRLVTSNATCFDPITETKKSAKEIYVTYGVECKIQIFKSEVERKIAAIQENVLHEPLSEFALLKQLLWLKENGVTQPAEQGRILARSAAWVSQSHNLLRPETKKIVQYIKENKLSRTAALNFINIPDDQIESVLEKAFQDATRSWEMKLDEATKVCKEAADEIGKSKAILSVASFMGDPNTSTIRSTRNSINNAKRSYTKGKKTLDRSGSESPSITDADVIRAGRSVGAADGIHKSRSTAELRKQFAKMKKEGCIDGLTEEEFRGAMAMARWMLDCSAPENIAELVDVEDEQDEDTGSD